MKIVHYYHKIHLLCCSMIVLFLTTCVKERAPELGTITLEVHVAFDKSYGYPASATTRGYMVELHNLLNNEIDSVAVGTDGIARFDFVSNGKYNIQVAREFSPKAYEEVFGDRVEDPVTFNAAEIGVKLRSVSPVQQVHLKLRKATPGEWVIKQLYYAGSDLYNAAALRDNFFEIYNNSDKVLYADSLCMMFVYGRMSTTYRAADKLLETGQFDWTKAVGTEPPTANANEDYLYAQAIYMFPGTGKTYPVQPGQSLVVARSAINHKAPFTNKAGKTYQVNRPDLTVDLSQADFEVITTPYLEEGEYESLIDIPTPGKTSLIVLQKFAKTMMMDNIGRIGYALFKTNEDIKSWPKYAEVKETTIEGKTLYTRVPKKYIIDAVETQPNTEDRRLPKKLSSELDAGFTFVPLGSYSSQAVIRKVKEVRNGRRILQDTNNSTNDFEVIRPAVPGGFKE